MEQAVAIRNRNERYQTKLEKQRLMCHLSQGRLAKLSGVKLRNIQSYEQRIRNIDGAQLSILLNLCMTLNCNLTDILEDVENIKKIEKVFGLSSETTERIVNYTEEPETKYPYEKFLVEKYFNNNSVLYLTEDQKDGIKYITKDFPEQWKEILIKRYLYDFTLEEIGVQCGITKSRVQQKAANAIKRLMEYEKSDYVLFGLLKATQKENFKEEHKPLRDHPISELNLSNRAYNCLMRAGYRTIGELVLARETLINTKNLGKHTLEEIMKKIDIHIETITREG